MVENDSDVLDTVLALSKFGINADIKQKVVGECPRRDNGCLTTFTYTGDENPRELGQSKKACRCCTTGARWRGFTFPDAPELIQPQSDSEQ